MLRSAPLTPVLAALALFALAGCTGQDGGQYPRLLPLSELNTPPAIPAHAADAAADPQAVGAAAATRADNARRPVTDAGALSDRAAALRRRAAGLAASDLPGAARTPSTQAPTLPATRPPVDETATDPDTAARLRALRERARALGDQPVGALPACPPGTADPVAARCNPG